MSYNKLNVPQSQLLQRLKCFDALPNVPEEKGRTKDGVCELVPSRPTVFGCGAAEATSGLLVPILRNVLADRIR